MATVTTAAAVLVGVLGIVGLTRAAVPQAGSLADSSQMNMSMNSVGASGSGAIQISNAYVREPASPDVAAAYFTVQNTSGSADTLISVQTGAGQESDLHTESGTSMADMPNGIPIPAHSTITLTPGGEHVMIQKLIGALKPGQTVDMNLTFARAGTIDVVAPVIAILAPAPSESPTK